MRKNAEGAEAFARRCIKVARGRAKIYGNVSRGRAVVLPLRRRQVGSVSFAYSIPPHGVSVLAAGFTALFSISALPPSFSRCFPHSAPPHGVSVLAAGGCRAAFYLRSAPVVFALLSYPHTFFTLAPLYGIFVLAAGITSLLSISVLPLSFSHCFPHPAPPHSRRGGVERGGDNGVLYGGEGIMPFCAAGRRMLFCATWRG